MKVEAPNLSKRNSFEKHLSSDQNHSNIPLYCLVNGDAYRHGWLKLLYSWVGFHPRNNQTNRGFDHCSFGFVSGGHRASHHATGTLAYVAPRASTLPFYSGLYFSWHVLYLRNCDVDAHLNVYSYIKICIYIYNLIWLGVQKLDYATAVTWNAGILRQLSYWRFQLFSFREGTLWKINMEPKMV